MLFRRKSTKTFAYEALIKYNVTSLPVPLQYDDGILIFTMQYLAWIHNQNVFNYFDAFGYRGFVCYDSKFDNYVIFINGEDPEPLQRWSISVAIGFIETCKFSKNRGIPISNPPQDIDDFTYIYTCPDCILERDNVTTPEQIIEVCKIPFNKAREKSKRLKLSFHSKNKMVNHLEKIICTLIS